MARIIMTLANWAGVREVDAGRDGRTAIEMLRRRDHHFVLCGLEMHPLNSAEFLRRARAEPLADGFLFKSLDSEALRAKILEAVEHGHAMTARRGSMPQQQAGPRPSGLAPPVSLGGRPHIAAAMSGR